MDTLIPAKKRKPKLLSLEGMPNQLRRLRIERGMTIPELAAQIGVTPQALHQAERLGKGIRKEKWYQLADFFDIDPRKLESP